MTPAAEPAGTAWARTASVGSADLLRVDTRLVVAADCATVHAVATDASRWGEWHPATRRVEVPHAGPLGLGETVTEHIATAGRRFQATWTVIGVEVPTRWVIATDTPHGRACIEYRLAPESRAPGRPATLFQRTLAFRSKSWHWRVLDRPMRAWVLVPQSRRALDNLKRLVESSAPAHDPD